MLLITFLGKGYTQTNLRGKVVSEIGEALRGETCTHSGFCFASMSGL